MLQGKFWWNFSAIDQSQHEQGGADGGSILFAPLDRVLCVYGWPPKQV